MINNADNEVRLVGGAKPFLRFLRAALKGEAGVRRFKTMKAALGGRPGCRQTGSVSRIIASSSITARIWP